MNKTLLSAAVVAALGVSAPASADTILDIDWSGWFTMVNSAGGFVNNGDAAGAPMYGNRTAITGTFNFNLNTGAGTGTVDAFSFFAGGVAAATTITMQAIGNGLLDGAGNPLPGFDPNGSLILGQMGFNWNCNNGIPVSLVLDAAGFFGAIQVDNALAGFTGPGSVTIDGTATGSTLGATDNTSFTSKFGTYTYAMGAVPMSTTTWNTTPLCVTVTPKDGSCLGTNPSGGFPLVVDTIVDGETGDIGLGGSPMIDGPFGGFNANFDVAVMTIAGITVTPIPVPAAVWLFGSGLLGLIGVARRRK